MQARVPILCSIIDISPHLARFWFFYLEAVFERFQVGRIEQGARSDLGVFPNKEVQKESSQNVWRHAANVPTGCFVL